MWMMRGWNGIRAENLDRVLNSAARHRVIVAGPGTGKTFTFKKVPERVDGPALVLSFLGSLVEDLDRVILAIERRFVRSTRTVADYCTTWTCPGSHEGSTTSPTSH